MLARLVEVSPRDLKNIFSHLEITLLLQNSLLGEYTHSFGKMGNIMQFLQFNKKLTHMDTTEKFYT
jgi:hypothetical protein